MLRFTLLVIVVMVGGIWHAASASAATVSHENTTVVSSFVQAANDCLAEDVQVTGELHVVTNVVEDTAGGTHVVVVLEWRNLVGTGTTSGAVYHGIAGDHSEFSSTSSGNEITTNFRTVLVSPSGANLVLHGLFHETIDADGTVRTEVESEQISCTG